MVQVEECCDSFHGCPLVSFFSFIGISQKHHIVPYGSLPTLFPQAFTPTAGPCMISFWFHFPGRPLLFPPHLSISCTPRDCRPIGSVHSTCSCCLSPLSAGVPLFFFPPPIPRKTALLELLIPFFLFAPLLLPFSDLVNPILPPLCRMRYSLNCFFYSEVPVLFHRWFFFPFFSPPSSLAVVSIRDPEFSSHIFNIHCMCCLDSVKHYPRPPPPPALSALPSHQLPTPPLRLPSASSNVVPRIRETASLFTLRICLLPGIYPFFLLFPRGVPPSDASRNFMST